MIIFSCPECDTEMEVPDSKAGAKVTCPECDERVPVPAAPKRNTKITAQKPGPKSAAIAKAGPKAAAAGKTTAKSKRRSRDEDDDEEPKKKSPALLLGIGGGLLAVALAVGAVFFFMNSGKNDPPEKKDPSSLAQTPKPPDGTKRDDKPVADKKADDKPVADKKADDKLGADKKAGDKPVGDKPVREKTVATGNDIWQHVLKSTAWIVVPVGQDKAMTGTGSLIDKKNRLVLTNYHVVHGQTEIVVFFPVYKNNKLVRERDTYMDQIRNKTIDVIHARVVEQDTRRDLALIQLERLPDTILPLAVAGQGVDAGDDVHSVGNPGASGALWAYTSGKVKQVYHKKWKAGGEDLLLDLEAQVVETQSPTNPGDSGGPLVNNNGELVGVTQGGSRQGTLLSIFIDLSEVLDFVDKTCTKAKLVWDRQARPLVVRSKAQVSDLIKDLANPDVKVRTGAAQELASMGPAGKLAIPSLVKLLQDKDAFNRRLALEALGKIGAPDKADVDLLLTCLKDPQVQVRVYAAEYLGKIGPDARAARPALLEAIKDSEATVRQHAARSLGQISVDAKETVRPALKIALKDDDKTVRIAAAEALVRLSAVGGADIPGITELLKHRDPEARVIAAQVLGNLGYPARAAIPALIEAAKDNTDREVRRAAISSLARFGAEAKKAVPVLIDAMKDEELRPVATLALVSLGPAAEPAAKVLAEALSDTNKVTRDNSLAALGKIGPAAKMAVPELVGLLKNKDRTLRQNVLAVLGQVGKEADEAIPELIKILGETAQVIQTNPRTGQVLILKGYDKEIHGKAIDVLSKIGKPALRPLANAINFRTEANELVRLGAVTALGAMGWEAVSAKRALEIVNQTDPDKKVREAAAKSWQQVQVKPKPKPIKKKPMKK